MYWAPSCKIQPPPLRGHAWLSFIDVSLFFTSLSFVSMGIRFQISLRMPCTSPTTSVQVSTSQWLLVVLSCDWFVRGSWLDHSWSSLCEARWVWRESALHLEGHTQVSSALRMAFRTRESEGGCEEMEGGREGEQRGREGKRADRKRGREDETLLFFFSEGGYSFEDEKRAETKTS